MRSDVINQSLLHGTIDPSFSIGKCDKEKIINDVNSLIADLKSSNDRH